MLPDVAAEVLRFLTRRDLDKACAVSKWLDAMTAQCCSVYPLRSLRYISLYQDGDQGDFTTRVEFAGGVKTSFASTDQAMRFAVSILRHSYAEELSVLHTVGSMALSSDHWTTLMDAMRFASVQSIYLRRVDFSALDADAFVVAVGCRGLQSLTVRGSFIPSIFVTDALLRASAASGLLDLRFSENESDAPHKFSEDALLNFFFAAGASTKGRHRNLQLQGEGITATFVRKLFERLQSSPIRPSGNLEFHVARQQRGLSAYAQYRAPGMHDAAPTDDNDKSYAVGFNVMVTWMRIWFRLE